MEHCHICGIDYEREFDNEETFEDQWVPRCKCLEDNRLLDDILWVYC
ncbi:MAG: hypothetical protein GTN76_09145 [Candidatus Aenigmarchaeota archaeon]|nr:hypothetical protein [Candidatus Aenigmarchaeota archaeon]